MRRLVPAELGYGPAGWRAAVLGVIAVGALPPLTILPLLLIALPGLAVLIGRARSGRVAAFAGLMFGLTYYITGLYWITEAILVMADQFWWAVPITVPLLSAVLGLFIAVPCGLAWLARPGWPRASVLAGGWALGDMAREFVLSGFPWNPLASMWEMPGQLGLVFMQPAAWVGAPGLTLFTVLLAGSLAFGRRARIAAAGGLLLWAACGYARLHLTTPLPQSPPGLTAVIVQGNISEIDHRDHGGEQSWVEHVFDKHLALTRAGMARAAGRPAIVIWPETASPYPLTQDPGARQALAAAAAPAIMTLSGAERFEQRDAAHNSLVAVNPAGQVAGIYDKSHLVPFGEYFPYYAHFILGEQGFVPGPGLRTMHLPGLPAIGPLICYEAIFPGYVVQSGDRPQLLVNITNDAWFGESAGPRQHLAAARLRSVEEGLPMLRAANTGISAVIDAHGRILKRLDIEKSGALVSEIPGALSQTIFSKLGLWVPAALSLGFLALGFAFGRRKHG